MQEPPTILIADDDPADIRLTGKAFASCASSHDFRSVSDGDELLDYLHHRGRFSVDHAAPTPRLILLDLNMPGRDGISALEEIKQDQALRRIPIVILTTSREERDIQRCYDLGANSFITKPESFDGWVGIARSLNQYWFNVVNLPGEPRLSHG